MNKTKLLPEDFYLNDAASASKNLLGKKITINGKSLIISETEAYLNENDLASHARFGNTKRSSTLFFKGGIFYVYMIYGMHYCTNIVVGKEGYPSAVLLRNGITEDGIEIKGPGRFSKYLKIDKSLNKASAIEYISESLEIPEKYILKGKRINVNYAKEWAEKDLRFYISDDYKSFLGIKKRSTSI